MLTENIDVMNAQGRIAAATALEEHPGLPVTLVKIIQSILSSLSADDQSTFLREITEVTGAENRDLSRVAWAFLASELRALPSAPSDVQSVIDPVIKGMDTLARGENWGTAVARTAARTAYSANSANASAAHHAAEAAEASDATIAADRAAKAVEAIAARDAYRAADACPRTAYAAARTRQRQTVLHLIRTA